MGKLHKIIVTIFLLYLFTVPTLSVYADGASVEALKREVESEIQSFNSDIEHINSYLATGKKEEARVLIGQLNEKFQTILDSDSLYKQIVKIRQDEPNYQPNLVSDVDAALDIDYGQVAREMTEAVNAAQNVIKDAKNNIGKQKALTWYTIFMVSLKSVFDINSLLTKANPVYVVLEIGVSQFSDNYWEYSDTNYIKERLDVQDINIATQQAIIIRQENVIASVKDKLNKLARLETSVYALHGEIGYLKNNIVIINSHINAALRVYIPGLADALVFDATAYIEALDANLDNVLDGQISWADYLGIKYEIKAAADEQYEQTIAGLIAQELETIPYTRSYNEFVEYYNTFDASLLLQREEARAEFESKANLWVNAVTTLFSDYDSIILDDYSSVDMRSITVDIPHIDVLDYSQRQFTSSTVFYNTFGGYTALRTGVDSVNGWYQPLLDHPSVLESNARTVSNLVNAARESEAQPVDDPTGIGPWRSRGFSALFSTLDDSLDASYNLEQMYDYLGDYADYAYGKTVEAGSILGQLETVRGTQSDLEAYVASVNAAFIPDEYVNQFYVSINTGKLPSLFGGTVTPGETDTVCTYIERDLSNFIFQSEDLSHITDQARQNIHDMYEFETEKYAFLVTVDEKAQEMVDGMQGHLQLLSDLDDFRDVYKGYVSGLDGSDSLATLEYLQEKMETITGYPGLTEFIELQKEIGQMTKMIKPIMDPHNLYGGFRGNYSVLESDRDLVTRLQLVEYVPSSEIPLSEIENGFPNVHEVLDTPYSELVDAFKHTEYMSGLAQEMAWYRWELDLYSDMKDVEFIQYSKSRPLWRERVIPVYGSSNGFKDDLANRQLYDQIKQDFIEITNAFIDNENEKKGLVDENGFGLEWVHITPDLGLMIPDEELDDPMVSIIYWLYQRDELSEYGLDKYLGKWDEINDQRLADQDASWEQEMLEQKILESIESGWDYVHPDDEGWCVYLNETDHPEFWVEQSKKDGLDYMNRNPDGSYPPYTGSSGPSVKDPDEHLNGTTRIVDPSEFQSRLGQEKMEQLELGTINNVILNEDDVSSEYLVDSEKSGKFLGVFNVNYHVQTSIDASSFEVIRSSKPWWAFLVFGAQ